MMDCTLKPEGKASLACVALRRSDRAPDLINPLHLTSNAAHFPQSSEMTSSESGHVRSQTVANQMDVVHGEPRHFLSREEVPSELKRFTLRLGVMHYK